ncbi:MAG: TrkH family potassium uptake protein [Anaerovoracaceae bacterium]|jgi:trk system potassium uptake protein TrkH
MDLNYRSIVRYTGLLLILLGLSLLLPYFVALIYHESDAASAFLTPAMPCLGAGALMFALRPAESRAFRRRDAYFFVSFSWLLFSLIGAVPFVVDGCIDSFVDAFFETCSGFSTTGASILTDVEALPKSMMFWRLFTHWIGGMGILVLMIALIPAVSGKSGQAIAQFESPGPSLSKFMPKMRDMAKMLYFLYGSFTLIEILCLKLAGMNWYDAIVYSFSTMGTGGFATHNAGIAAYHSAAIEWVLILFMILAGVNFNLYYLALARQPSVFRHDAEFRMYMLIIGVVTLLCTLDLLGTGVMHSVGSALRAALFQVVSILTTTGFSSADYTLWPTFCMMLLFLLFFIGGCSSSTAGGIKVVRVTVLLKLMKRSFSLRLHPNAFFKVRLNHRQIPSDIIQQICSFTFLYIITVLAAGLLISIDGNDLITNFSAAASCVGNIGPGFNAVGPAGNYSIFSPFSTCTLAVCMIAGRLELFTFFMLVTPKFWNPSH